MKLKFIIIPAVVLLVLYAAFAQTSYITPIAMNISIGNAFEIFVDMTNNRVGIGNSIPNVTLDVSGDMNVSGNFTANNRRVVPDFQRFTDTSGESTWTKPAGATFVIIEVIGGGGGGGAGDSNEGASETGGGGGGGGALVRGIYYGGDGTCAAGHTDNGDGTCTATFYPDANAESTSVDGQAQENTVNDFATIRGDVGDSVAGGDAAPEVIATVATHPSADYITMTRGALLFDTSALPDNAIINNATLGIAGDGNKRDQFAEPGNITLVTSAPASNTAIVAGDYDSFGTTRQAPDILISSFVDDGTTYNDFVLNAIGIGNINKTGISKFGIRIGFDTYNNEPTFATDIRARVQARSADAGGTSTGPKLVVTYTTGLPPTLKISVGAGGAVGAGGSSGPGSAGSAGGNTYVNSTTDFNLTAYGGGGGGEGDGDTGASNNAKGGGGGGGGGTGSVGTAGVALTAGNGGNPTIQGSTQGNSTGGRGAKGGAGTQESTSSKDNGNNAELGGGGGGGGGVGDEGDGADAIGGDGGSSIFAAGSGGGGGGHRNGAANTGAHGGKGGAWGSYAAGGGGTGGDGSEGDPGGAGTSRNYGAGDGGGGASGASSSGAGGVGGAGGTPGGGGGGGGAGNNGDGGAGGAGGRGEVRIWSR